MFFLKAKNKRILILTIILAAISFSACNNKSDEKTTKTEDSNLTASETVTTPENQGEERVLRIAVNTERDSFDPYLSAAADTSAMMLNIFEGLTAIDTEGNLTRQGIAEKYTVSADSLEYTFDIFRGIKFHNGKDLTADDVVFSYKRLSGLDGGEPANSAYTNIKAVEKLGDYKVKFTLEKADPVFLSKCAVAVVPEGYTDQESFPIGTGPYKFISYTPGQSVRFERFDDYYVENLGGNLIKSVEFVYMPDDSAKVMALRSGAIDIFEAAKDVVDQVSGDFNKYHGYSNMIQLMALNNEIEPFDNKLVRQAMNYAIDRQEIIDLVTGGEGYGIYTTFSPAMKNWYNTQTENVYLHDQEKAIKLLKEAGYENGFNMEITVPSNYQIHMSTAQIIVNQLSKVGINAIIKPIEWGQWLEEVYTNANYHTTIVGLSGKDDPHDIAIRFMTGYRRNFYNFTNKAYDALVQSGIEENDIIKRASIYKEAQKLLTEEAAAVFIQDPGRDVVSQKDIAGYEAYPISFWDLSKIRFAQ